MSEEQRVDLTGHQEDAEYFGDRVAILLGFDPELGNIEKVATRAAHEGRCALRRRRWLGLDRQPVFRVTSSDCAEVEMLKGALEMSNRYPEPRIG